MDALSLLLACSAGILNYFRCRTSVPLKSQGGEGRALLPFCPSPGLVSQLFPENLSPTGHFLSDSFQESQLSQSLAVFLCLRPTGLFSNSSPGTYIPALAMSWKGFFFLFYFFLILFCLCFCCCCSIHTFQNCHAGLPLLPTAVRPPYKETFRANKKQTM